MKNLIKLTDEKTLVDTASYPYGEWDFEKFNCVQSSLIKMYDKNINGIVAASTSAGKTVCSELFLAQEIRKNKSKGMMLVPIKALAQERYEDWTGSHHHFSDLKISVCTGDHKEKKEDLENSDLVIMTSEMLNSKSRGKNNNDFIKSINTLVVDEGHLITTPGRGDHLEVGLMKYSELNPNGRIIILSATMPNVEEIANWLRSLNPEKECFILNSGYRPCPLNVHYEPYYDGDKTYDKKELEKIYKALDIVNYYEEDKFIIFVHTKKTGELIKNHLKSDGIETEFHNANLEKSERNKLEKKFKEDKNFRVIIATSTLACGLNMPARRVVITGVHRGLEEVETYNIMQMCGRAGRPRFDKNGDAYILLPESDFENQKSRLRKQEKIESQLLKNDFGFYKVLAFHLVNEINNKTIETAEDIKNWYKKSLCSFQSKDINENILEKTLDALKKRGIIYLYENKWKTTNIGKISSLYYYPPFDVADLKNNLKLICDQNLFENDYILSFLLANVDSLKFGILSKQEKQEVSLYDARLDNQIKQEELKIYKTDNAIKNGYCYYTALNGLHSQSMSATIRNIQIDFPRTLEVLKKIDSMELKQNIKEELDVLGLRISYGAPKHLVSLCKIKNIGKQRAKKLYESNIKTIEDFTNQSEEKLSKILNLKTEIIKESIENAKNNILQNIT